MTNIYSLLVRKDNSFTKCYDQNYNYVYNGIEVETEPYHTETKYYLSRPKSTHEFCQYDFNIVTNRYFFISIHFLKMEMIYTLPDGYTQFMILDLYANNSSEFDKNDITKKAFLIYEPKQAPKDDITLYRLIFTLPKKMQYRAVFEAKKGILNKLKNDFRIANSSYIYAPDFIYKGRPINAK